MAITTLFFTKYLTSTIGDNSSNQLPVTKSGAPTISTVTPPQTTGNSSLFTGNSNDFYYITDTYASVFPKQAQFATFECWFNLTQIATRQTLFCKGTTSQQQFALEVGTDNKITFYSQTGLTVSSTTTISINTWYHVAVTLGAGGAKIWVNGVGQATASGILSDFTDSFYIGVNKTSTGSYTRPLFGYIANVRVYSGKLYTQNFTPTFYLPTLENTYTLSYDPEVFNQADVGIYINSRENKLDVCQKLANSIGGHLVTDIDGNFKLIQITNGIGQTPKYTLTDKDILERSLQIGDKLDPEASVKIGYCKNWTVQESGLANGLPAESISLFARPYFYASDVDYVALENYNQSAEPVAKETLLITDADSQAEATRQLNLKKVSRFIYTVTCYSHMLLVELGDYIQISHPYRFGLVDKIGTVVSVNRDWLNGRVTLSILVVGEPGYSFNIVNLNNPQDTVATNIITGEIPVAPTSALISEFTVPEFLANQSTTYFYASAKDPATEIQYGNNKFVLITNLETEILTSTDNGGTWDVTYSNPNENLHNIVYGNGKFVVAGINNSVLISTDAVTWTVQNTGSDGDLYASSLIYGNGIFVYVSRTDISSTNKYMKVYTSTDAVTWTLRYTTTGNLHFFPTNLVIGPNKFLIADASGYRLFSNDGGITWVQDGSYGLVPNLQTSVKIVYGNGKYVAVGSPFGQFYYLSYSATSTDGITWTQTAALVTDQRNLLFDTTDNLFITYDYYRTAIYKSTDGISWTATSESEITSLRQGVGNNTVTIALDSTVGDMRFEPAGLIAISTDNRNTWAVANPIVTNLSNQLTINWGDGNSQTVMYHAYNPPALTHTYTLAGTYEVTITGTAIGLSYHWSVSDVKSWGSLKIVSMQWCFNNTDITGFSATNTPDLSICTSMEGMFSGAWQFNSPIDNWDVSNIRNLSSAFEYTDLFNQPLNSWNVSNVTTIDSIFQYAVAFNQPLNNWNTSNVTDMLGTFFGAESFNQNINSWNVSNVTNMYGMFYDVSTFNHPLSSWNVSNVTDMGYMFYGATLFNQSLNSWNVSSVVWMYSMFELAPAFNQPLNNWNTANVVNMNSMFERATAYSQDLSSWNVSKVIGFAQRQNFNYLAGPLTPPNWVI